MNSINISEASSGTLKMPGAKAEMNGMNRVWSTIEPQLENRISFQWVKMAAVILLLLIPSVFLVSRETVNREGKSSLNNKLTYN